MTDFKSKTVSGLFWSVTNQVGKQILNLGVIGVLLMRFVPPSDYGLFQTISIFSGFVAIYTELGLGAALIQKKDVREEHLSSAFWLHLGMGAALAAAIVAFAPMIAGYFREPHLQPLLYAVAVGYVIASFNIVQNILLTKSLNFKAISIVEIAATAAGGLVAVPLAALKFGAWSLIANYLVYVAASAVMLWNVAKWRPKFMFRWSAIRELLGFGANYLGTQTIFYGVRNIDMLLIGRYFGKEALGLYGRAFSIMLLPLSNISLVVSRVMFPAFSSIQDDKAKVKDVYLQLTRAIILLTFPMMAGLCVVAQAFVYTLFGEAWRDLIPLVRIMCVAGMVQSIASLNSNVFLSQGRADLQFRVGLALRFTILVSVLIGLNWGIKGVAIANVIISTFNFFPSTYFAGRLVGLRVHELLATTLGTLACTAAMAAAVLGVDLLIPDSWLQTARLAILVSSGIVVYATLVHTFKLRGYQDLKGVLLERLARRPAPTEAAPGS